MDKEKRKEINKKYYEKNKEKIKQKYYMTEPIICKLCNGKYKKSTRLEHLKSKKHNLVLKIYDDINNNILNLKNQ